MSGGAPVQPVQQPVDETGAVGIPAAGWVDEFPGRGAGNLKLGFARVDGWSRRPRA